ncbi:MAG: ParB N-terminal domain-containing protein [Planctomycetota bacterium]
MTRPRGGSGSGAGWLGRLRVWGSVEPRLLRHLLRVRYGCLQVPVAWRDVPAGELRYRREPVLVPGRRGGRRGARKAESPIERFFPLVGGKQDRRLRHTPHYRLLEQYRRTGRKPYAHDYTRLLVARARLRGTDPTPQFLRAKVDSLCATFDSIRRRGYLAGPHRRSPIVVFERPFHPPRPHYEPTNYEIFDGHHRAAAVCLLGLDPVRVLVLRAVRVGRYDFTEDISWDEARWPETS